MSDERDPFIHDALRQLAKSAPSTRPDRLAAVVAGARKRQQTRLAATSLTAVAFVVAAAVGVHTWSAKAVQPVSPNPATSELSPAVSGSAAAATSAPAVSSGQEVPAGGQPSPASSRATTGRLVATVKTAASVMQGDPAVVVMTVTNEGSVATHSGTFVVQQVDATDGGSPSAVDGQTFSAGCRSAAHELSCTVGTLEPGHSLTFSDSVRTASIATSITFEVRWQYSPPSGGLVSSTYRRVVAVQPAVASSPPVSPISSGPPSSGAPSSSGAPVSGKPVPPASSASGATASPSVLPTATWS